jgi:hypothetical protein
LKQGKNRRSFERILIRDEELYQAYRADKKNRENNAMRYIHAYNLAHPLETLMTPK